MNYIITIYSHPTSPSNRIETIEIDSSIRLCVGDAIQLPRGGGYLDVKLTDIVYETNYNNEIRQASCIATAE